MRIDIRGINLPLSDGLERHTRDRLTHALAGMEPATLVIAVRLSDVNGPRGGADKLCHITATARRRPPLVVQNLHADAYVAIAGAAAKLRRAVLRQWRPRHWRALRRIAAAVRRRLRGRRFLATTAG